MKPSRDQEERKKLHHKESDLQIGCKRWFDLQYPPLAPLFFAVPNGGFRNPITAKIMHAEGIVAGVSDMILLVPNRHHNALCVEFKTETGKQSPKQVAWERACTIRSECKYIIVRNGNQFIEQITAYLRDR